MHAFMGVVRYGPRPIDDADKSALAEVALSGQRPFTFQKSDHALFMCMGTGDDPQATARFPDDGEALFVGIAFIHNAKDIAALSELSLSGAGEALVHEIFLTRGDAGLAMLRGAFAFAHWNAKTRELTLARDCGGGRTLFFYRSNDLVIFASNLPDLISHRDVPRELDERIIASFLAHDSFQHRRTFFRGIDRVPTRHAVTITRERMNWRAYWAPDIRDDALYSREEDYVERARELLDQAVARTVSDDPHFAVLSSGGLDSAAIVSTLARSGRSEIPCYTILHANSSLPLPADRYADERPHTEALAKMYPALRFHYITAAALADRDMSDMSIMRRCAIPFRNVSNNRFAQRTRSWIATEGFGVQISGAGGNLSLTWNGDDLLPYLARKRRWFTLAREAHSTAVRGKSSFARVLAHELVLPSLPVALRRAVKRRRSADPFSLYGDMPLKRDIIAELDLPGIWHDHGFDPLYSWPSCLPVERAKWLFDQSQLSHDTYSASPAVRDVEARRPLTDRDLLEFALNVPPTLCRRDGVGRQFARRVLADRVPPEILNERRRGSQAIPWFEMLTARRHELAAEVEQMEHSMLANRLFDIPRLRQLVRNWPQDAQEAQKRRHAYMLSLDQAVHVFQFIRWATKGNA